jgi:hypothetical protein
MEGERFSKGEEKELKGREKRICLKGLQKKHPHPHPLRVHGQLCVWGMDGRTPFFYSFIFDWCKQQVAK